MVVDSGLDVFAHNVETVEELQRYVWEYYYCSWEKVENICIFSSRNIIIVAEIFFEYIYLNKLRLTYPEILCLIVFFRTI